VLLLLLVEKKVGGRRRSRRSGERGLMLLGDCYCWLMVLVMELGVVMLLEEEGHLCGGGG
jgi:hypothetical protein